MTELYWREDIDCLIADLIEKIEKDTGRSMEGPEGDKIIMDLEDALDHPHICCGEWRNHN
jgi:hypothetical protein